MQPTAPDARTFDRHRLPVYLFLAAAIILGASRFRHSSPSGPLKPAPTRKLLTLAPLPQLGGGEWDLAGHHGEVVLINYWATWCEPCQEELPTLLSISREYTPNGLAVIAISLDRGPDAPGNVQQFATRYRITYPIAFPSDTWLASTTVMALPTTILVDRQGRVARTYTGAVDLEALRKDVSALFAEP